MSDVTDVTPEVCFLNRGLEVWCLNKCELFKKHWRGRTLDVINFKTKQFVYLRTDGWYYKFPKIFKKHSFRIRTLFSASTRKCFIWTCRETTNNQENWLWLCESTSLTKPCTENICETSVVKPNLIHCRRTLYRACVSSIRSAFLSQLSYVFCFEENMEVLK